MDDHRLPDDLEAMPPGPELCSLLASVDRRRLSDPDRVRLARAHNRLASHVQGELYADLYACTVEEPPDERALARDGGASRYPWAEIEVAFALTWTRTAAGVRLEHARQLLEELPEVGEALRAGALDMPKVLVICDLAGWLEDPAVAGEVVARVLHRAPGWTTGQLRARLRRLVLAVDPEAAPRRCTSAVTTRRVDVFDNHDGTGEVWGRSLAPQGAAAARERLTAIARAAKSIGTAARSTSCVPTRCWTCSSAKASRPAGRWDATPPGSPSRPGRRRGRATGGRTAPRGTTRVVSAVRSGAPRCRRRGAGWWSCRSR